MDNNGSLVLASIKTAICLLFFATFLFPSCNTFASSISLTVANNTMSVNASSIKTNGTFTKSNANNIIASTDNLTGYTLSIAASSSTNSNKLINGSDSNTNTNHLDSITEAVTEETFSALNSTAYNGKWGYLPSKYHSGANTDFLPAPTVDGDVLNVTECANGTTGCPNNSDQYTITLGARIDSTTKLGTYSNNYAILVVANAIPYTIIFDDNVISNMPTDIDSTSMSENITLPANVPIRDGYDFIGWCDTVPTNSNNTDSCSGTTYSASGTYAINGATSNNLHLYAMWEKITYIQDFSLTQCATEAASSNVTVTDQRDNKKYTVRYIGSACWMTQNLAFEKSTLNSTTSNVASTYTLENPLSYTIYDIATDTNCKNGSSYYIRPCMRTDATYGARYNLAAASATTYINNALSQSTLTYDICPAGWHLPNASEGGSLNGHEAEFNPVTGGRYWNGSITGTTQGQWWTKNINASNNASYIVYSNGALNAYSGSGVKNGYYVRCVRTE